MRKALIGAGIGLVAALIAILLGRFGFVRTVELKTYDWRVRATSDPASARTDIVLVNIDEQSISRLEPFVGRWPWPRAIHAYLLDFLARARPKAVLYDVLFTERDRATYTIQGQTWTGEESDQALIESASRLKSVIFVGDVNRLPATGSNSERGALPPAMGYVLDDSVEPRPWFLPPLAGLLQATGTTAHDFAALDPDGVMRRHSPFVRVQHQYIPSLAVAGAVMALGVPPRDVHLTDRALLIGSRRVPLITAEIPNYEGVRRLSRRALVNFRGTWPGDRTTYREYSFADIFEAEDLLKAGERAALDPGEFRDKVVIVGATAAALHDLKSTPFPGKMSGPEINAAFVDSLLSDRFLAPVSFATSAGITLATGIALALIGVYFTPWSASALSLGGGAALIVGFTWLFSRGQWIPLVAPLMAGAIATFGGVTYQYLAEGREKRRVKLLFSRYVSKDVYDQLLEDPHGAQLGGHRRHMTVLFSDIRGFTTISESGQPEAVVAQLNEYFSRMVPIVFAHRGTVDKFVGDMIMALFGAPLDDAEHADHAVETALAMLDALAQLNGNWTAAGRPALEIGVGINTGDMVAGNLGSQDIMSYTVIGDEVNLGSRLESLNKQFHTSVIISEATRVALKGRYDIRALGDVVVKGKSVPVSIYSIARLTSATAGLNTGALSTEIPEQAAEPPGRQEQGTT